MKLKMSIIVAYDKNRVIGYQGRMPWHIRGELSRLKEITLGKTVVMGRKTYESIGHPLEGRQNIILTRNKQLDIEGTICVSSLEEMHQILPEQEEVFILGGSEVYQEVLPFVDTLYVTWIDGEFKGDCFFPTVDNSEFDLEINQKVDGDIPYTYVTYRRKLK